MAAASASGAALGMSSRPDGYSPKIGRTSSVQPGQIAGADAPRLAERMPATKVPPLINHGIISSFVFNFFVLFRMGSPPINLTFINIALGCTASVDFLTVTRKIIIFI